MRFNPETSGGTYVKYPTPERIAGCEETNQRWIAVRKEQREREKFAAECFKTMRPSEFLIRQSMKNRPMEEVRARLERQEEHRVDMRILGFDRVDTGDYRTGYC